MENHYQQVAAKLAIELAQARYDLAEQQVKFEELQQQVQRSEEEK